MVVGLDENKKGCRRASETTNRKIAVEDAYRMKKKREKGIEDVREISRSSETRKQDRKKREGSGKMCVPSERSKS